MKKQWWFFLVAYSLSVSSTAVAEERKEGELRGVSEYSGMALQCKASKRAREEAVKSDDERSSASAASRRGR